MPLRQWSVCVADVIKLHALGPAFRGVPSAIRDVLGSHGANREGA